MRRIAALLACVWSISAWAGLYTPPTGGDTFTGFSGVTYTSTSAAVDIGPGDVSIALKRGWGPVPTPYPNPNPTGLPAQAPGTMLGVGGGSGVSTPVTLPIVNYACVNSGDDVGINASLALGYSVHVIGTCSITNQINVTNGQALFGDGDHKTKLVFGSGFSSSATGQIVLTGTELNAPYVHDLAIIDLQPTGLSTVTTAATASGTTIQTNLTATVGDYVYDPTTPSAIPLFTTVTGVSGSSGAFVLTLSATVTGVLNGDTIGINPSRAKFAALGSCTTIADGTGCQYPPAIYAVGVTRMRVENVHIEGAWNCVNTVVPGSGTDSNTTVVMDHIDCGALNIGWEAAGAQDNSHVSHWHDWNWGFQGTNSSYSRAWTDGSTIGFKIGRMDGLTVEDALFENAQFVITADANNSVAASQFTDIYFDGWDSNVTINGGINFFKGVEKGLYTHFSNCPITVTSGNTSILGGWFQNNGTDTTNGICQSGGTFALRGIYGYSGSGSFSFFSQTGGLSDIESNYFVIPNSQTVPYFSITGTGPTGTTIKNNASGTGTGTVVSIATDLRANAVSGNTFQQYTCTFPTGAVLGNYGCTPVAQSVSGTSSSGSVAVGPGANYGTTGSAAVTAIGAGACRFLSTGTNDTCIGSGAFGGTTQSNVTAIGAGAAGTNGGGSNTTAVGTGALSVVGGTVAGNTAIGYNACNTTTSGAGVLCLGSGVTAPAGATSNWLALGNAITGNMTVLTSSALSTCGTTPAINAQATDINGTITTGSGATACTLAFTTTKSAAPSCVVSARSGTAPVYTTATASLQLTTAAASAVYDYWCSGK